jgi:hypothetical protein
LITERLRLPWDLLRDYVLELKTLINDFIFRFGAEWLSKEEVSWNIRVVEH